MTISITDEEWDELSPENFETAALLRAVDAVDVLRCDLIGRFAVAGWPVQQLLTGLEDGRKSR